MTLHPLGLTAVADLEKLAPKLAGGDSMLGATKSGIFFGGWVLPFRESRQKATPNRAHATLKRPQARFSQLLGPWVFGQASCWQLLGYKPLVVGIL